VIFKKIAKDETKKLYDLLEKDYDIIAPVNSGKDKNGENIYLFNQVESMDEVALDYTFTKLPLKNSF
jgi:hypothetical protein